MRAPTGSTESVFGDTYLHFLVGERDKITVPYLLIDDNKPIWYNITTVMSAETHEPNGEEYHEDPRTELAEKLRGFVLQAIEQQRVPDSDEKKTRKAGSLYKIDGGFLKVHLQPPAADHVFYDTTEVPDIASEQLPNIWILIPLKKDGRDFGLEDIVLAAEDITVHVLPLDGRPMQFLSRDDYLGPLVPVATTVEEMIAFSTPTELEQTTAATGWQQLLDHYDIRTITATQIQQPDVA